MVTWGEFRGINGDLVRVRELYSASRRGVDVASETTVPLPSTSAPSPLPSREEDEIIYRRRDLHILHGPREGSRDAPFVACDHFFASRVWGGGTKATHRGRRSRVDANVDVVTAMATLIAIEAGRDRTKDACEFL